MVKIQDSEKNKNKNEITINMNGCGAIDKYIEDHFGSINKRKLFNYYEIFGDLDSTRCTLKRLISEKNIPRLEGFTLFRKSIEQLEEEQISCPHDYEDKFPKILNQHSLFGNTKKDLEQGKIWIANCVKDRISFRNLCFIDKEYQDFIMKFQVLFANTEMARRRLREKK